MEKGLQRLNEIKTVNNGYVQVMNDAKGCMLVTGYTEGDFYNRGSQVYLTEQELRSTINVLNTALYRIEQARCFEK